MIPYGRQNISEEDIQAVTDVLRSDFLTQGPRVPEFEKKLSEYCHVKYATAVNSATSALHVACLSLGLKSGDILWTSPITFVASANCALYCGANVDFVDIESETHNISIIALQNKLEKAKSSNTLPKILVVVHFAGQSCDMKAISELSNKYGFKVIEDASHALGGRYGDQRIGSCEYSDICVFSFHPVKIITSGEGGVATTNNKELYDKMNLFRTHGISRDPDLMTVESEGGWYYQQIELGYNYRLSDIHAALGLTQLQRLDKFVKKRNSIAKYYEKKLKGIAGLSIPKVDQINLSAFHLYIVRVNAAKRKKIFNHMRESEIGVNVHYIPVYKQPYFQAKFNFIETDYPESEQYYKEALTLPIYPGLTRKDQDYICNTLLEVLV
jgi:UDP-4-amino-4,6-dideoxy-N-acetyl-beta-L-altrosamine transaminase